VNDDLSRVYDDEQGVYDEESGVMMRNQICVFCCLSAVLLHGML